MDWIAAGLTLVFVAYMIVTDRVAGTSYSISNSYYKWKEKKLSGMFIIFLGLIYAGLAMVVASTNWKHDASAYMMLLGGGAAWGIGVYADFRKSQFHQKWHNYFSVACFSLVLFSLYIQGVRFPLEAFLINAAALAPIKLNQRTTVIEAIGISQAISGVFYL